MTSKVGKLCCVKRADGSELASLAQDRGHIVLGYVYSWDGALPWHREHHGTGHSAISYPCCHRKVLARPDLGVIYGTWQAVRI